MSTAAKISTIITANQKDFEKNMAKASAAAKKFQNSAVAINRKLKKIGKQATAAGKQLTMGLTAPLALIGGLAVKTFADFEQEMAKVNAVSGATGEEFAALSKLAEDLGRNTRFTATEVATLQLNYSKLGFVPAEIQKITGATLDLALATGEDLAQSAEVAGGILRAFGKTAKDMPNVVDVMAKSFSSSALNLEKFKDAMKSAAPVANAVGATLEETTAVISTMVDANIDASTAGTTLRNMFLELSNKGLTWKQAMDKIKTSTDRAKTANDLFGKRAVAGALVIADNTEKIQKLTGAYNESAGAAQQMAAIMDDTLQGSLLKMKSAAEGLAISFGATLKPIVSRLAGFVADLANKFTELSPETKKIILVVAGLAAAIGPLLVTMGFMASTVLPALISGFALLAGPVGAVVIAIGVAAFEIQRNWDDIVDYFTTGPAMEAWVEFSETTKKIFALIPESISDSTGVITQAWDVFIANFIKPVKEAFDRLFSIVKTAMGILGDVIDAGTAAMAGDWETFWNEIKSIVIRIFSSMISGITLGVNSMLGIVGTLVSFFDDEWGLALEKAQQSVTNFADDLVEKAGDFIGFKKDVEATTEAVKELNTELEVPPIIPASGGSGKGIGAIGGGGAGSKVSGGVMGPMPMTVDELKIYQTELDKLNEKANAVSSTIGDAFTTMGNMIVNAFGQAETGMGRFVQALASSAIQVIAQALSTSIANSIMGATSAGAFTGPAAPIVTPTLIATMVGGVVAAFASIPKFADGGFASSATMAMVGEGRQTSKSNPEVMMGLDKLKGLVGGAAQGSGGGTLTARVSGQDLLFVLKQQGIRNNYTAPGNNFNS